MSIKKEIYHMIYCNDGTRESGFTAFGFVDSSFFSTNNTLNVLHVKPDENGNYKLLFAVIDPEDIDLYDVHEFIEFDDPSEVTSFDIVHAYVNHFNVEDCIVEELGTSDIKTAMKVFAKHIKNWMTVKNSNLYACEF